MPNYAVKTFFIAALLLGENDDVGIILFYSVIYILWWQNILTVLYVLSHLCRLWHLCLRLLTPLRLILRHSLSSSVPLSLQQFVPFTLLQSFTVVYCLSESADVCYYCCSPVSNIPPHLQLLLGHSHKHNTHCHENSLALLKNVPGSGYRWAG